MSDIVERIGQAIVTALTASDFEASHMRDDQLKAAALAAIKAMRVSGSPCGVCGCPVYPIEEAISLREGA